MARLPIRLYPDPILKQVAQPVDQFGKELGKFLDDMYETMCAAKGIGLAAPQVGNPWRVAVVDVGQESPERIELINPEIVSRVGKVPSEEGCLSIPDYRDTIERSREVVVRAFDRTGKEFEIEAADLLSICLQHEIDHLNGILFVDHLSRLKRELFKRWLKKQDFSSPE